MTYFDKIYQFLLIQKRNVPNVFFPKSCGVCGKVGSNWLCNKCELQLKNIAEFKVVTDYEEFGLVDANFSSLIYIFKYEGIIRKLILDYKFNEKSYMYLMFVYFMLKNKKIFEIIKKYDKIIPVPVSKKRKMERGYNQSLLIAKEIAKYTNLQLVDNCLIKTKNIIEQSKLNKDEREKNIQGVYSLKNKQLIHKKRILLIDDIYTTGNTVNECSKILKQGNPKEIGVIALAKD